MPAYDQPPFGSRPVGKPIAPMPPEPRPVHVPFPAQRRAGAEVLELTIAANPEGSGFLVSAVVRFPGSGAGPYPDGWSHPFVTQWPMVPATTQGGLKANVLKEVEAQLAEALEILQLPPR